MKLIIDIPEEEYFYIKRSDKTSMANWASKECMLNAIKNGAVIEEQPCEDCISRQAVHEMLENIPINGSDKWFNWLQKACLRLAELPSVQPTRPTGKWIDIGDEGIIFKCSLCGLRTTIESHYCPNCGARMEV